MTPAKGAKPRKRAAKKDEATEYVFIGLPPNPGGTKRRQLGSDALAMHIGQRVTIVDRVPASEPGAHDDIDDSIVAEWGQGDNVRRTSFAEADFAEWFEEAK